MFAVSGLTKAAGRCSRAVSLLDIYPTLIELCGLKPKPELEGQSLVPLLCSPSVPRLQPAITTYGKDNHAVRTDRWRYIRYQNGDEELYDHSTDPNETINLATNAKYDSIKKDLALWLPKTNAPDARNLTG